MLKNDSDDDKYQRASNEVIPFMQASSNKAVTPAEAPQAVQQDQVAAPAEASSSQLSEHDQDGSLSPDDKSDQDLYDEICNNSPVAKLFQANNVTTLVDKLCG